jgi:pimeloyl-ACP methyl ester carboxylesterase
VETRAFETSLGPIWLRGEPAAFVDDRPIVLVITGAFAPPETFDELGLWLPQAAVLIGDMPGNRCPPLAATSAGAFMAAYSAVIAELARPTVVCGASLGGLVALGLRAPNLVGLVALDPLIRTSGLSHAIPSFRAALAQSSEPNDAELIWNVFGVSPSAVEERSYVGVLGGLKTPTWCLFGEAPSGPASAGVIEPSIVGEADRELLRAHPAISTQVAPGAGHLLHIEASGLVLAALHAFLDPLVAAGS